LSFLLEFANSASSAWLLNFRLYARPIGKSAPSFQLLYCWACQWDLGQVIPEGRWWLESLRRQWR